MYILLCGYPPFKGKTHNETFGKIQAGKFSFSANEWKDISREAKVLIKKMLTYNPDDRITADKALNDEWILEQTASPEAKESLKFHLPIMGNIIDNISRIKVK